MNCTLSSQLKKGGGGELEIGGGLFEKEKKNRCGSSAGSGQGTEWSARGKCEGGEVMLLHESRLPKTLKRKGGRGKGVNKRKTWGV